MSAMESSWAPRSLELRVSRAMRPSRPSSSMPKKISTAAQVSGVQPKGSGVSSGRDARKTAKKPASRLPSVNIVGSTEMVRRATRRGLPPRFGRRSSAMADGEGASVEAAGTGGRAYGAAATPAPRGVRSASMQQRPDSTIEERELVRARLGSRVAGAALALAALGVLGIAAWLSPAAAGVGTHTQLGLAPCGFLAATGLPCATCGMTTATSLAAHGRLLSAAATQPAGLLFAVSLGCLVWLGGWLASTGRPAGPVLAGLGRVVFSGRGLLVLLVVVGGSWGFKAAQLAAGAAFPGKATAAAAVHPAPAKPAGGSDPGA